MSIDDTDKFQQKEMKKIKPIKQTWYDWLINDIPHMFFKTTTPKQTVWERKKTKQTKSTKH